VLEAVPELIGDGAESLQAALSYLLAAIGPASLFNLKTAVEAARVDGVSGELTIHVPRKVGERVEVDWQSNARPR
jgi:hypothetical protein